MNFDYSTISTSGILNALDSEGFTVNPNWSRERAIQESEMLINEGRFDTITLILELDGE